MKITFLLNNLIINSLTLIHSSFFLFEILNRLSKRSRQALSQIFNSSFIFIENFFDNINDLNDVIITNKNLKKSKIKQNR